uniref:Ras-related protein Rab-24 n=1 Tax=Macrostomum lignano TaxID=282301 RepID=A0A1I8FAP2_9PLAT
YGTVLYTRIVSACNGKSPHPPAQRNCKIEVYSKALAQIMNDSSAYDAIKVVLRNELTARPYRLEQPWPPRFFAKSVLVGSRTVKLHLWDTAGSEEFRSVIPMYYRHARAAVLCYDITNYRTFNDLQYWIDETDQKEPDCRLYLCGCKSDLQQDKPCSISSRPQPASGDNVTALFHRNLLRRSRVGLSSASPAGQRSAQRPEDPAAQQEERILLEGRQQPGCHQVGGAQGQHRGASTSGQHQGRSTRAPRHRGASTRGASTRGPQPRAQGRQHQGRQAPGAASTRGARPPGAPAPGGAAPGRQHQGASPAPGAPAPGASTRGAQHQGRQHQGAPDQGRQHQGRPAPGARQQPRGASTRGASTRWRAEHQGASTRGASTSGRQHRWRQPPAASRAPARSTRAPAPGAACISTVGLASRHWRYWQEHHFPFVTSQAALARHQWLQQPTLATVLDCIKTSQRCGSANKITLKWVPVGMWGSEEMSWLTPLQKLVPTGSSLAPNLLSEFLVVIDSRQKRGSDQHRSTWANHELGRQSRALSLTLSPAPEAPLATSRAETFRAATMTLSAQAASPGTSTSGQRHHAYL